MKKHLYQIRTLSVLTAGLMAAHLASAATAIWSGAGADGNWSTIGNWSGATPAPTNDVKFYDAGSTITNVVDVTQAILSLQYGNSNNAQNTLINPSVTLSNLGTFIVGTEAINNVNISATILGAGGTLVLSNAGANFMVRQGGDTTGRRATLDMSGLDTFIADVGRIYIGRADPSGVPNVNRNTGWLYLGRTNRIQCSSTTAVPANTAIEVGRSGSNNGGGSRLYLGQTNEIYIASLGVGMEKETACQMLFNSIFTSPVVYMRGADGSSRMTLWTIGDGESNSGTTSCQGTCDFSGGTVDAMVTTMTVGRAADNTGNTSSGNSRGTLTFNGGTIDVNTLQVGIQPANNYKNGDGTVNVLTNATLIVNTALRLGQATAGPGTATTVGRLNIDGGTVRAYTITTTTNATAASPSPITLNNGGALIINTTIGVPGVPISDLTINDSLLGFVSVNSLLTNIVVNNLTTGGTTNLIFIQNFPGITSFPVRFRLIQPVNYPNFSTGFNFGLTNLPAGYTAYLTNDPTFNSVDLVVTAGPVAEYLTWSGTASANWDTTTLNWLAGASPRAYASGDYVTFDDTASVTSVNLTTTLLPSSLTISNTTKAYTFSGSGGLSGSTGLTKTGGNTFTLANSGVNDFTGPIAINGGTLAYTRSDDVIVANVISGTSSGTLLQNGTGTLALNGANTSFTGAVTVAQGTLQTGSGSALGSTNVGTTVISGATLDVNAQNLGAEPVTASGLGADGNGAIVNTGADQQNALRYVTLTGDTTVGGVGRWDIRSPSSGDPSGARLSTGGAAYKLIKTNYNTVGLVGATVDPALGDVEIRQGMLAVESATTCLGNPASNLTVWAGGILQLYNLTNELNKVISFTGDGVTNTVNSSSGANVVIGPVTLNGNCRLNVGGISLTFKGPVGGSGSVIKAGASTLVFAGSNTFSGIVTITNGTFVLNGYNNGGGVLTNTANATIAGNGTNAGPVAVNGALNPGNLNLAGTFGSGALTLYAPARLTFDLASVNTTGGGVNDLIEVAGNVTSTSTNPVVINLLDGTLQAGTYRLINYSGTLSGFKTNVVLAVGGISRYDLRLDTNTLGQVNLVVGGSRGNLKWNSTASTAWDVTNSVNWLNLGTGLGSAFYQYDSVLLDDSVSGVQPNLTLAAGIAVAPSVITNNSDLNNFAITGTGKITGGASLVKQGSSTLLLGTSNDFVGPILVQGGILQVTNNQALGATNGGTIIASGATLDLLGVPANNVLNLGMEPIIVSGSGVGGNGAIINSGANQQYNSIRMVTLAGDTWFGGPGLWSTSGNNPGRWDVRGSPGTLNTGGQPYNLYKVGSNQVSIVAATVDPALANIDIQQGLLGFETSTTSMGNPANTLTVRAGATLSFYNTTPLYNKVMVLYGDGVNSSIYNWSGSNTFIGPVTLNDACVLAISGTALTLNGPIGGSGGLTKANPGALYLTAANTYSGSTLINAGTLALLSSGTINNSSDITLGAATLDVTGRSDGTLTLASGQTLAGRGTVRGNVIAGPGTVISPGDATGNTLTIVGNLTLNNSSNVFQLGASVGDDLLAITNNLTLSGVTRLYIAASGLMSVGDIRTIMTYGGALNGTTANFQVDAAPGYTFAVVLTTTNIVQVQATAVPVNTYWLGGRVGGPTLWDTSTFNWTQDYSTPTNYANFQVANFGDYPAPNTNRVSLVGSLNPTAVLFNSYSYSYTLDGSGNLTGPGSVVLQGGAPVIFANSGSNDYSGLTTILYPNGVLQIGNSNTYGNLPAAGSVSNNGALVFNRSDDLNVPNPIFGTGSFTNVGTGVLTLSGSNALTGEFTAARGTLRVNNNWALGGTTAGGTTVLPGATLDLGAPSLAANALYLTNELITVSGWGVNSNGAIINSSTNRQFNALRNVVLVGDTTFGGPGSWSTSAQPGRWDIRGSVANSSLYTGNYPYNLTKIGSNQVSFVSVNIDSTPAVSLADIDVKQGLLGFEANTTSMGDPGSNLVVRAGAAISFYNTTNLWNKVFILYGDGVNTNIFNWSGTNTMIGPVTLNGGCVFAVPAGSLTNNGSIGGSGSLIKNNAGLMVLGGANIYSGNTVINDGRLAFAPGSTLPASPVFDIAGDNAVLDLSGIGGALTLNSGQTLRGNGTLWGSLTANPSSTVAPGESIGTLTITNDVTLNGTTVMELDRGAASKSDQISTPKSVTVNGTLTVTNIGAALAAGDSFKLFSAASYSGTALSSVSLPSLGTGLVWTNSLAFDGKIAVYATTATWPTNVTWQLTGNQLTLSWPPDHTGWSLETNSVDVANTNFWFTVPGSETNNQVIITIDPANPHVFYRLVYP